jgi:hypothetical protein
MTEMVCRLQLLLILASAVILESESRGNRDHIFLSQIRESPNLESQVPGFISPRNRVAQLYIQALGSIFVASYHSQGYDGGIRTRLHAGITTDCRYIDFARTTYKTPLILVAYCCTRCNELFTKNLSSRELCIEPLSSNGNSCYYIYTFATTYVMDGFSSDMQVLRQGFHMWWTSRCNLGSWVAKKGGAWTKLVTYRVQVYQRWWIGDAGCLLKKMGHENRKIRHLTISRRWIRRLLPSGMRRRVVWYIVSFFDT